MFRKKIRWRPTDTILSDRRTGPFSQVHSDKKNEAEVTEAMQIIFGQTRRTIEVNQSRSNTSVIDWYKKYDVFWLRTTLELFICSQQ